MSISPIAKRMKSTKVIGTHSGTFHCDGRCIFESLGRAAELPVPTHLVLTLAEALAVFMLRLTDEFKDAGESRSSSVRLAGKEL
jgi:uncharacterized UPF0160 family protein